MDNYVKKLIKIASLADFMDEYEFSDEIHHNLIKLANYSAYGYSPQAFIANLKSKYPFYGVGVYPTRGEESFWILPDGSSIAVPSHHNATANMLKDFGIDRDKPLYKEKEKLGIYEFMNEALGGGIIRVSIPPPIVSTVYAIECFGTPTSKQMQALQKFKIMYGGKVHAVILEKGHRQIATNGFDNFELTVNEIRAKQPIKEQTVSKFNPEEMIDSEHEQTSYNVPYWKQKENMSLEEEYPGDDFGNQKIKELYQKSAMRTANVYEYGITPEEAIAELRKCTEPYDIDHRMMSGTSLWLLPSGELLRSKGGHYTSAGDFMRRLNKDYGHPIWGDYSNLGTYPFMSYVTGGAIRVYMASVMEIDASTIPTPEQMNIIAILSKSYPSMDASISVLDKNGKHDVLNAESLSELMGIVENIRPKRQITPTEAIDPESIKIDRNKPYWKQMEDRSLIENYPIPKVLKDENTQIDKELPDKEFGRKKIQELYQKSAKSKFTRLPRK